MSTLAYAAFTTKRDEAKPGTSSTQSPPGVSTYVDAVAALVPAEVLTLHAVILTFTTETTQATTKITEPVTLSWAFWGLIILSIVLYILGRLKDGHLDWSDGVRAVIPPCAFVAWTMLQRATAFDAIYPDLEQAPRTVIALFIAVVLGLLATSFAKKADEKTP